MENNTNKQTERILQYALSIIFCIGGLIGVAKTLDINFARAVGLSLAGWCIFVGAVSFFMMSVDDYKKR